MKTIIRITAMLLIILFVVTSCNEDKFLEEQAVSIYLMDDALETNVQFQQAVNQLYRRTAEMIYYSGSGDEQNIWWYGNDQAFCSCEVAKLNYYRNTMIPTYGYVENKWGKMYRIVSQANLILSRLEGATFSEAEKMTMRGEALFFRAFMYRFLGHLWGGVPLVLEEITTPRRDFNRSTRQETYNQVRDDLLEAISLLDNIESVKDGKVSKQMAQHLLAEIYISLGEYDNAISMATAVIDYPEMELMTWRWGSKINEEGSPYSDLHRSNNQNRSSGNKEALWVCQWDYNNSSNVGTNYLPSAALPDYDRNSMTIGDWNGLAFIYPTAEKGGNGEGWVQATKHAAHDIWEPGDLRNAPYLIVRDQRCDNPESPAFGKWIEADGYAHLLDHLRYWHPWFMKVTADIPGDYDRKDTDGNIQYNAFGERGVNTSGAFKDLYFFRLAETYLLRAEAYLGKNDPTEAAKDINIVRRRSGALEVHPDNVDIDYLLDERLRELIWEESRTVVLCRMGKLAERTRKYNTTYNGKAGDYESSGATIEDYHNLWPIPYNEIDRNIFGKMEQNPGYLN